MAAEKRDFQPTRWTLVLRAKGADSAAQSALSDLCAAYYAPVVSFLRYRLGSDDAAREQAHAFFAQVLAGSALSGANPERGRFRSYLLGALRHFMADAQDRAHAAKRGGGVASVSFDAGEECNVPSVSAGETAFDRQWALTVVARAMDLLNTEWAEAGKAAQFEVLKHALPGSGDAVPIAIMAEQLAMSEGSVKVAIHRLRTRFRDAVKAEIAQTVPEESDIDDELRHLVAVLSTR